jgi:hypothetical protein
MIKVVSCVCVCSLLLTLASSVDAQQRRAPSADLLRNLPGPLDSHAAALGDRVRVPGKEKTIVNGQFVDRNGKTTPVRVTLQLPGLLRVEGLKTDARTEEALQEALTSDTAEGMLASIKDGAAVHLIGRRVKPDVRDIYEVARQDRLKRYLFDSDTGLLASTQYMDESFSPPMNVETRFSEWRVQDGSQYPGRIERFENGHPAFLLDVNTITASPRQDPASFR